MNFQDNLVKVRDLYVVLSFISIREITLYFLVHYKAWNVKKFLLHAKYLKVLEFVLNRACQYY